MSRLFVAANSDKIVLPNTAWASRFSFSAWIYPVSQPAVSSGLTILSNATGSTNLTGYRFAYENDGSIFPKLTAYWTLAFGLATKYTHSVLLTLNEWHHLVWTYTGAAAVCYVDGAANVPVLELNNPGVNVAAFGANRIGCWFGISNVDLWFWDGRIGEVAFLGDNCNPVLSAGEVLNLYRGAYLCELRPTGPTNHYEGIWMLEGLFDPEPDWSGHRRHSISISGTSRAANPPTAWYPPLIPSYPLDISGGSGSLGLSMSVLVQPAAYQTFVPAPGPCVGETGDASRPPDPETGA